MSLFKQLLLAICLFLVVAFTGSFMVSLESSRTQYVNQLRSHAQDAATALALSLTPNIDDPAMVELLVSSIFDSGYYASIRIVDVKTDQTIVERTGTPAVSNVPDWFVKLIGLEPAGGGPEADHPGVMGGEVAQQPGGGGLVGQVDGGLGVTAGGALRWCDAAVPHTHRIERPGQGLVVQGLHSPGAGTGGQGTHAAGVHHLPGVHEHHVVGHLLQLREDVAGDQHRGAVGRRLPHHPQQAPA